MPSSVVRSFSYDAIKNRLRVEFISGMIYDYLNVPVEVYNKMRAYRSKGSFLNRFIKGKYGFQKVADE